MSNEPAFPRAYDAHSWVGKDEPKGMSLRDYFAAKAMQAILINRESKYSGELMQLIAETAYEQADAMLAERDKL